MSEMISRRSFLKVAGVSVVGAAAAVVAAAPQIQFME